MAYHFNKAFYQKQLLAAIEKRDSLQIDVYREHLFAARRNQDLFIQQLKIDYPKYFQLKYDQQTAKLTEIQKYLPSKTVMLEYFIANEYIHIFTISKSGVQLSSVFKAPLFETGLNQFLQHLQQSPSTTSIIQPFKSFAKTAHQLYQTLVDTPIKQLDSIPQQLIIIPDASLHYLPFEVLLHQAIPLDKVTARNANYAMMPYLIHEQAIFYAYSSTLWVASCHNQNPQSPQLPKVLAFAPFSANQKATNSTINSKQTLPASHLELKNIAQIFKGRFYYNKEATKKHFIELAQEFDMIHLSTHSHINTRQSELSYIEFFNNSVDSIQNNQLYVYELYNLDLTARLVTLSACQTGAGKLIKGEGIMSLARGFMYAGCPSIVLSLWEVNDETAAILIKYFYEGLSFHFTKSKALQQAKKQYLHKLQQEQDKVRQLTAHPYYWASFVGLGNYDAL